MRPTRGPHNAKPLAERYWPRVDRSGGPDACWPWLAARLKRSGYGIISTHTVNGRAKTTTAHRVGLALARGVPLASIRPIVRHSCDNPPCQNPRHLDDGTQAQNIADAQAKGRLVGNRHRRGDPRRVSKLSLEDVAAIKAAYALPNHPSQPQLANQYGVSLGLIWQLLHDYHG